MITTTEVGVEVVTPVWLEDELLDEEEEDDDEEDKISEDEAATYGFIKSFRSTNTHY